MKKPKTTVRMTQAENLNLTGIIENNCPNHHFICVKLSGYFIRKNNFKSKFFKLFYEKNNRKIILNLKRIVSGESMEN